MFASPLHGRLAGKPQAGRERPPRTAHSAPRPERSRARSWGTCPARRCGRTCCNGYRGNTRLFLSCSRQAAIVAHIFARSDKAERLAPARICARELAPARAPREATGAAWLRTPPDAKAAPARKSQRAAAGSAAPRRRQAGGRCGPGRQQGKRKLHDSVTQAKRFVQGVQPIRPWSVRIVQRGENYIPETHSAHYACKLILTPGIILEVPLSPLELGCALRVRVPEPAAAVLPRRAWPFRRDPRNAECTRIEDEAQPACRLGLARSCRVARRQARRLRQPSCYRGPSGRREHRGHREPSGLRERRGPQELRGHRERRAWPGLREARRRTRGTPCRTSALWRRTSGTSCRSQLLLV